MDNKLLILDFGSQYTQLIARRVRELNVYCEIHPYNKIPDLSHVNAVILSGSPCSVRQDNAPNPNLDNILGSIPLLGICYGAQYLVQSNGGLVEKSDTREYGRAILSKVNNNNPLLNGIEINSQVWMSHGDTISSLAPNMTNIASTKDVVNAAFTLNDKNAYGIQFHPEVFHSTDGKKNY
jgi:GMP synthase (glutamine-hydrolysing)